MDTRDTTAHTTTDLAQDPEAPGPVTKNADAHSSGANTAAAQARPAPARAAAGTRSSCRGARTAFVSLALVCYIVGCLLCVVVYWALYATYSTDRRENAFLIAASVLVGIGGPLVAGINVAWLVWAAKQTKPAPRVMRYTLHLAPVLAHGVLVMLPFTLAACKKVAVGSTRDTG